MTNATFINNVEIKYAGFCKRLASILIDAAIFAPVMLLRMWLDSISITAGLIGVVAYCALITTYDVWFVAKYGQTPGKMAVGIKVVKVDGSPVAWKEALLRHSINIGFSVVYLIVMFIAITKISEIDYISLAWNARNAKIYELFPSWMSWVNTLSNIWVGSEVVVMLFNKKRRALHDFIAGTIVIHSEKRVAAANGIKMVSDAT